MGAQTHGQIYSNQRSPCLTLAGVQTLHEIYSTKASFQSQPWRMGVIDGQNSAPPWHSLAVHGTKSVTTDIGPEVSTWLDR